MSGEKKYPDLRFRGFKGDWKSSRLVEITEKIQDGTHFSPDIIEDEACLYITSKNIRMGRLDLSSVSYISKKAHDEIYRRCDVKFGDVLLTKDGASTGNVCINTIENEFSLLSSVAFIRPSATKASSHFIYQILSSNIGQREIIRSIAGQAITRITLEKLRSYRFYFPPLPEQKKIAEFLGVVDGKLAALREKEAALTRFKRGLMQALFSQTLRFTRDDGSSYPEWKQTRADNLFASVSNKQHSSDLPIIAVTQDRGAVLRSEIEIDIKSSAASIASYKVVEPGDFIISLRSFQGGVEYSEILGICSPAYTILKPKVKIVDDFYKAYFKKERFIRRLAATVIGIRDGKQISYSAFGYLKIPYPHPDEQQKIADALTAMDAKIGAVSEQVEQLTAFKKSLLQQMFV